MASTDVSVARSSVSFPVTLAQRAKSRSTSDVRHDRSARVPSTSGGSASSFSFDAAQGLPLMSAIVPVMFEQPDRRIHEALSNPARLWRWWQCF